MQMTPQLDELLVNMAFRNNSTSRERATEFFMKRGIDPDIGIPYLIKANYIWEITTSEDEEVFVLTPKGREYVNQLISGDFWPVS